MPYPRSAARRLAPIPRYPPPRPKDGGRGARGLRPWRTRITRFTARRSPSTVSTSGAGDGATKELDEMKRRLKEMEEEAAALREMQAKFAKEMQGGDPNAGTSENKEEMDARSVFVGNVGFRRRS